jgi:hypothetical protein
MIKKTAMQSLKLNPTTKKWVWSGVVILIGILSVTSVFNMFLEKTFLKTIDKNSSANLDEAFQRAVTTFAIVRGINGIISVIQNTDIAVSPAGVGVSVAAGEIVDPINDLVERFSWVMLVSATSLGIQKILLKIGTWLGFNILLSISMLMLLIGIWRPQIMGLNLFAFGGKLILLSVVIRFCVPFVTVASDTVYDLFLQSQYDEATQSLDQMTREIKDTQILEGKTGYPENETDFLDQLKKYYKNAEDLMKLNSRIQELKRSMSDYAKHTISLIVVFILQTIVIPIFALWVLIRVAGYVLKSNLSWPGNLKGVG